MGCCPNILLHAVWVSPPVTNCRCLPGQSSLLSSLSSCQQSTSPITFDILFFIKWHESSDALSPACQYRYVDILWRAGAILQLPLVQFFNYYLWSSRCVLKRKLANNSTFCLHVLDWEAGNGKRVVSSRDNHATMCCKWSSFPMTEKLLYPYFDTLL